MADGSPGSGADGSGSRYGSTSEAAGVHAETLAWPSGAGPMSTAQPNAIIPTHTPRATRNDADFAM